MSRKEIRRSMKIFPMGPVMQLTGLSARQIRYYEEHGLVKPERTKGNRRLFSLNDIERLLEIKDLIDKGVNLAGIKQIFSAEQKLMPEKTEKKPLRKEVTDEEIRKILRFELAQAGRFHLPSLHRAEASRFFH